MALALQLGLAFGHLHADDIAPPHAASTAQPLSDAPAGGHPDHHDCAICAVLHTASAVLMPSPPAIPLPAGPTAMRLRPPPAQAATPALPLVLRARGPPYA